MTDGCVLVGISRAQAVRGRRARGVRRAGGDGDGFDRAAVTAAVERLRRENERLRDELEAEFEGEGMCRRR